jgi:nucleotide-binding universal stress UspA family protein
MYKKILIPYDDSEPANRALDHAVNLAKLSGQSEVILLHVIA